jgi:hypothetical protein
MSRWPNTLHWQRVVMTFRTTDGSRWRTAAAEVLGCEKRLLRARIDCVDMHPVRIKQLDDRLIERLHSHAAGLRERARDVDNVAREVMRADNEVSPYCDIEIPVDLTDDTDFIGPIKTQFSEALAQLMEDI